MSVVAGSLKKKGGGWFLAAALLSWPALSIGGCASKDKKIGQQCVKNGDCVEGLLCLKPSKGPGTCVSRCGTPQNKDPEPGHPPRPSTKSSCSGETICLAVKVLVTDSGCNRTHRAQTEINYCVSPDLERRINDGARFLVTPR